ncbi:MAG: sigma-70 family RNA polymerase sigma factor [Terracidiphilus sp.]
MRPELTRASDLLRNNTPEAVAEAIGLLQSTVFSFSMKMCGHREDAEDTAQEVLFRSLKHLPKLQDPSALAAWLYTVARNRCIRLRGAAASAPARNLSLDDLMPDAAELGELLLDSGKSPEGKLLRREEHQLLHRALLRIPTPLRLVLVLHDMEELDTELVARILGLQAGTVRVRLHRARLALRKEIAILLKSAPHGSPAQPKKKTSRPIAHKAASRPKECRELFATLSEYLDGRIEPEACEKISAHIQRCPACVAFLRDLRAAIDRCRSVEVACDPSVISRLQAMLTREYLRMVGNPPAAEDHPEL